MFVSYSASYDKGAYYGYKLTHAQTFGNAVGVARVLALREEK